MKAGKWNFTTHEYEDYDLPDGAAVFCSDMARMVSCAECGRKVMFGDCYTSRRIHAPFGMGYAVCWDCYEKEIKAEVKGLGNGFNRCLDEITGGKET